MREQQYGRATKYVTQHHPVAWGTRQKEGGPRGIDSALISPILPDDTFFPISSLGDIIYYKVRYVGTSQFASSWLKKPSMNVLGSQCFRVLHIPEVPQHHFQRITQVQRESMWETLLDGWYSDSQTCLETSQRPVYDACVCLSVCLLCV